ncbi:AI-2E family transporter [Halorientalis salina]|uniref:AI-2E family transporter n=1 Tax=Halorientalis salina TaxID=2932266 RepID=UPI0010AD8F52|nr:AI-2E family transporter [Halorientalis salina]
MLSALSGTDRYRTGWWLFTLALGGAFAFVVFSFVGTFVFGVFLYYGLRPLQRRLQRHVPAEAAATIALLVVALPMLVLVGSLAVVGIGELLAVLDGAPIRETINSYVDLSAVSEPLDGAEQLGAEGASIQSVAAASLGVLAFLTDVLLHLFIAVTVAFYLLRDDERIRAWFEGNVAGQGTTGHAYATAVDRDLGTIYFGNVLLVGVVAAITLAFYHAFNLLAPTALTIPFPTALALLTGVASMVPIVVGKLVYVPLTAYLGTVAFRTDPSLLAFPIALFVACLVFADLVPMGLLLPRIAGRKTHVGLVLFAYILGPILFGWYGLFLGPLLLVLGIQTVRINLTELLHGRPLTPRVTAAGSIGSDPAVATSDGTPADHEDGGVAATDHEETDVETADGSTDADDSPGTDDE